MPDVFPKGKRLTRRSTGNKLNLSCVAIITNRSHISLIHLPLLDGRIPVLNVELQVVAGVLVPFIKSRIIEPGQLKSESETAGPAEEFN